MKNKLKALLAIGLVSVLAGCKLAVMVPSGGDVTSASGINNCVGGSLCEFNITDATFNESFTAVARSGYVFTKWHSGPGFLCANSANPVCTISNVGTAGNAGIEAVIATGQLFYAMPLFDFVGIDTDGDGVKDHLDEDDDNDGVFDIDDPCPLDVGNTCANMDAYSLRLNIKTDRIFVNEDDKIIGDYDEYGVSATQIVNIYFKETPFMYNLFASASIPFPYGHATSDYGYYYAPVYETPDCSGPMFIVNEGWAVRGPDGKIYVADTSRPRTPMLTFNSVWAKEGCITVLVRDNSGARYARVTDIDLGVSGQLSEKYL